MLFSVWRTLSCSEPLLFRDSLLSLHHKYVKFSFTIGSKLIFLTPTMPCKSEPLASLTSSGKTCFCSPLTLQFLSACIFWNENTCLPSGIHLVINYPAVWNHDSSRVTLAFDSWKCTKATHSVHSSWVSDGFKYTILWLLSYIKLDHEDNITHWYVRKPLVNVSSTYSHLGHWLCGCFLLEELMSLLWY